MEVFIAGYGKIGLDYKLFGKPWLCVRLAQAYQCVCIAFWELKHFANALGQVANAQVHVNHGQVHTNHGEVHPNHAKVQLNHA